MTTRYQFPQRPVTLPPDAPISAFIRSGAPIAPPPTGPERSLDELMLGYPADPVTSGAQTPTPEFLRAIQETAGGVSPVRSSQVSLGGAGPNPPVQSSPATPALPYELSPDALRATRDQQQRGNTASAVGMLLSGLFTGGRYQDQWDKFRQDANAAPWREYEQTRQAALQNFEHQRKQQLEQLELDEQAQSRDPNSDMNRRFRETWRVALPNVHIPETATVHDSAVMQALYGRSQHGTNRQEDLSDAELAHQRALELEGVRGQQRIAAISANRGPRAGAGGGGISARLANADVSKPLPDLAREHFAQRLSENSGRSIDQARMDALALDTAQIQSGLQSIARGEVQSGLIAGRQLSAAQRSFVPKLGADLLALESYNQALQRLQGAMSTATPNEIRAALTLGQSLPPGIIGDRPREIRRLFARARNVVLKERSGATVTDPEWERLRQELGILLTSSPEEARDWVNESIADQAGRARRMRAKYDDEVVAAYDENFARESGTRTSSSSTAASPSAAATGDMVWLRSRDAQGNTNRWQVPRSQARATIARAPEGVTVTVEP